MEHKRSGPSVLELKCRSLENGPENWMWGGLSDGSWCWPPGGGGGVKRGRTEVSGAAGAPAPDRALYGGALPHNPALRRGVVEQGGRGGTRGA